jgi:NOL1/NOP2/fmu family ribosome biogenesis protein
MFRKDEQAVEEWSEANVNMCAHRQQDILSAVWPSLREGGFLIYSTCTFNKKENEHQIEWLKSNYDIHSVSIEIPESWNICITETEGIRSYRFFPHRTEGEGFFLTVIQKAGQGVHRSIANRKQKPGNISKMNFPFEWLKKNYRESLIEDKGRVFLQHRSAEVHFLSQHLNLVLSAIPVAELKGKDWIPSPELALSSAINTDAFSLCEVEKEDALRFLKTEEIKVSGQIGWNLICFQNLPLGWIKQLPNRSNNYFPKEWKIRMEIR